MTTEMTEEEAHRILSNGLVNAPSEHEWCMAFRMAIKALEQPPCEDCISRQAVLDVLDKNKYSNEFCEEHHIDWSINLGMAHIVVNGLKSVTPRQKIGHWVEENINEWSRKVSCSECGCAPPFEHINSGDVYSASGYGISNKTKYCPNCGAKMKESQESEVQDADSD